MPSFGGGGVGTGGSDGGANPFFLPFPFNIPFGWTVGAAFEGGGDFSAFSAFLLLDFFIGFRGGANKSESNVESCCFLPFFFFLSFELFFDVVGDEGTSGTGGAKTGGRANGTGGSEKCEGI